MTFRFEVEVLEYNIYGDKITERTPASFLAKDKAEVTEKVRAAFNAKYDNFRKFWSHGWRLDSVTEIADSPAPAQEAPNA